MKDTEKENPAYTKAGGVDAPAEETRKSVRALPVGKSDERLLLGGVISNCFDSSDRLHILHIIDLSKDKRFYRNNDLLLVTI